jgi:hypothetical protein
MSAASQTDLDSPPPVAPPRADWGRRNLRLLAVFGPLLIVTGVSGLLLPPGLSLMSGAAPYDIFHILFGALGLAIVLSRSAHWAALFNLGFGAVDLYQALAGAVGFFPAGPFGLRPADHVVHVLFGLLLVAFGVHRSQRSSSSSAAASAAASSSLRSRAR